MVRPQVTNNFLRIKPFFQEQEKTSKRLRRERVFMHGGGSLIVQPSEFGMEVKTQLKVLRV